MTLPTAEFWGLNSGRMFERLPRTWMVTRPGSIVTDYATASAALSAAFTEHATRRQHTVAFIGAADNGDGSYSVYCAATGTPGVRDPWVTGSVPAFDVPVYPGIVAYQRHWRGHATHDRNLWITAIDRITGEWMAREHLTPVVELPRVPGADGAGDFWLQQGFASASPLDT
jgi:hypothetical protein